MGIGVEFENMAKKIQDYASMQKQADGVHELVLRLESVCMQACRELAIEFDNMKNPKL